MNLWIKILKTGYEIVACYNFEKFYPQKISHLKNSNLNKGGLKDQ